MIIDQLINQAPLKDFWVGDTGHLSDMTKLPIHQNQDCCPAIFSKMETINLWSFKQNISLFPAILHSTSLYDVLQQSKTTQIS